MDCPDHRCDPVDDAIIVIQDPRGICTYKHVLECSSHAGCKAHDACYDVCTESKGETSLSGPCHSACNSECYKKYGYENCAIWADIPVAVIDGDISNQAGEVIDWNLGADFDGYLFFSDPPEFTPKPLTPTVTATGTSESTTGEPEPPLEIPDILKDKPKIQNNVDDWKKAAQDAFRRKDYEGAAQFYEAAEASLLKDYKDKASRPASVDTDLADIESSKAGVYANWPGHDAEKKEAIKNSRDLQASAEAKNKQSSWDLPGFEFWAAAFSVMFIILFRRIKQ
jgi:hypothetical protein